MKQILCKTRLEAIAKAPRRCKIIRRISPFVFEAYESYDDYYEHLLTIGKKVDARWLKKRNKRLAEEQLEAAATSEKPLELS